MKYKVVLGGTGGGDRDSGAVRDGRRPAQGEFRPCSLASSCATKLKAMTRGVPSTSSLHLGPVDSSVSRATAPPPAQPRFFRVSRSARGLSPVRLQAVSSPNRKAIPLRIHRTIPSALPNK